MRLPGLFVAFFLSISCDAAERWIRFESPNFELLTDGPKGRALAILDQFERVREFFQQTIRQQQPLVKPRIVIFNSAERFQEFSPRPSASAYYFGLPHRDYIIVGPPRQDADERIAVHEYIHLLVKQAGLHLPVWLNEGLAELYSTLHSSRTQVRIGEPIVSHIQHLRSDWMNTRLLFSADPESDAYNHAPQVATFYAMSWAVTHLLCLEDVTRQRFGKFVEAVERGRSSEEALELVYQLTPEQLEEVVQRYVRSSSLNVASYRFQFEPSREPLKPVEVVPVELGIVFADLLISGQSYQRATQLLTTIARTFPDRPEPLEGLAAAMYYSNRREQGAALAAAAFNRGSRNLNLLYAGASMQLPGERQTIARRMLLALLDRHPDHFDARLFLASLELEAKNHPAAWEEVNRIRHISGRDVARYFPVYIQAAWFGRHVEEARRAAVQFEQEAVTPAEREAAAKWRQFTYHSPFPQSVFVTGLGEPRLSATAMEPLLPPTPPARTSMGRSPRITPRWIAAWVQ